MWLRGEDSYAAEAGAMVFAETMLRIRAYLEAKASQGAK